MYRLISTTVVILLLGQLQQTIAYKWITLSSGDPIPDKAIRISTKTNAYVGRARHYDELLPAEIYNSTYSLIMSCSKEIIKQHFEILVATGNCEWQSLRSTEDVPENIVRAGNAWNGEPIYVAKAGDNNYAYRIASVFLTSDKILKWINSYSDPEALICDDGTNWIDTSAAEIPNNTISAGNSNVGHKIFVARLKRDCNIIPGQVTPEMAIASAVYGGNYIESFYCQVLIGDASEYSWVTAYSGEIPDYAVSSGREGRELRYVARINGTVGYIVHGKASTNNKFYEILTRNVK